MTFQYFISKKSLYVTKCMITVKDSVDSSQWSWPLEDLDCGPSNNWRLMKVKLT